jgi:hypothetical protein
LSLFFLHLLVLVVHKIGVLEDALESLFKSVDVIVDQVLLVDFGLIDQAHQRQVVVNLSQVEHNIFLGVRVAKTDVRAGFFIELTARAIILHSVDARNVNQHVNQLRTNLVVQHINGRLVSSDVYLRSHVEKERFLNVGARYQCVHHRRDEGNLGQQLLYYF